MKSKYCIKQSQEPLSSDKQSKGYYKYEYNWVTNISSFLTAIHFQVKRPSESWDILKYRV